MKKVLIVSPHFPPINAPDMQRVRLALPHLRAHGWEPTVLAVAPTQVEGGVQEALLETTYPADIEVTRVQGAAPGATRWAGFGNLWFRCGRALTEAGDAILSKDRYDLVFFSTTQFAALVLGPRWRKRFNVPYVVDYQDPWVNDYYAETKTKPPGGWLKFSISQWSARRQEPRVLRDAGGVIAVSDGYGLMLAKRYPWFDAARMRVLPFGASEGDFGVLQNYRPANPLIDFADGNMHHVYAGRCGPDMADALRVVLRAFRLFRDAEPKLSARMRFHFVGTGYAPPPLGEDTVLPIAQAEQVTEFVREHRYRVPYFDALYYLQHAHALLAVGSSDPTYSASKIFPYILARRPLLILFHARSPVLKFAEDAAAGMRFAFRGAADVAPVARAVCEQWFLGGGYTRVTGYNEQAGHAFAAETLTARLVDVFNAAASASARPR